MGDGNAAIIISSNNRSKYRMDNLKLYIRILVGRDLRISNKVIISALKLSNYKSFRALKIFNRLLQYYRALKLSKQVTEPVGPVVIILDRYRWVQPLPSSDRVKNAHCYTMWIDLCNSSLR